MGNCVSAQDREEKARSDAIDRQIEEDSRKFRKECKILLLGTYLPFYFTLCLFHFLLIQIFPGWRLLDLFPSTTLIRSTSSLCSLCSYPNSGSGESGKSTIVKQMKIIHQNGFTKNELMTFRPTIYRNTLDSAQAIVLQMRNMNVECVTPANRVRSFSLSLPPQFIALRRHSQNASSNTGLKTLPILFSPLILHKAFMNYGKILSSPK